MEKDALNARWPGWTTVRLIGHGSFGAVYEIERDVLGEKERAALKVISIPTSSSDIDELYGEGYDEASITDVFHTYLRSIVSEYSLMRKLNGSSNVVNCDDVSYIQHDDGIGWDIYIKMELLTPLTKALDAEIPDEQVIRIGSDICKALILCKKHNIVHRDIKPANIFYSEHGDYKLGDFGIAKTIEKTSGGTKIGTYEYMAPEIYHDEPYGNTVDIYSLGMVLYWLLNERRGPFLKMPPAFPTTSEKEEARKRRFRGDTIPAPLHGSEELKRIVLKAIAYDPKERYQSPEELLYDLENVPEETPDFGPSGSMSVADDEATVGAAYAGPKEQEVRQEKDTQADQDDDRTVSANRIPGGHAGKDNANTRRRDSDQADISEGEEANPEKDKEDIIPQSEHSAATESSSTAVQNTADRKKGKTGLIVGVIAAAVLVIAVIATSSIWKPLLVRSQPEPAPSAEPIVPEQKSEAAESSTVEVEVSKENEVQAEQIAEKHAVSAAPGYSHTLVLFSDGSVSTAGYNFNGQCEVYDWTDVIAVSANGLHSLGLRADGTVLAAGYNDDGRCDVGDWRDITAISAGGYHSLGLRSDHTVVATGFNQYRQCNVGEWTDIVSVSAGDQHSVGLKTDGTVVAVGDNRYGQCDVSGWTDIVAIDAGAYHTVALKSDGTVVATGLNDDGQCDVREWSGISMISAGDYFTLGMLTNGTAVSTGKNNKGQCDVSGWHDLCMIAAGTEHTVGLQTDGVFVAVGYNDYGQCFLNQVS